MKVEAIRKKLRHPSIHSRASTLTTAFASAIAPYDLYRSDIVRKAIRDLKQDPENLKCVFCGEQAEGWDHLEPLIVGKSFSGYGHWLGNLVPCCGDCNALKRGQNWPDFLKSKAIGRDFSAEKKRLQRYIAKYGRPRISPATINSLCGSNLARLNKLRDDIFDRMEKADKLANIIHEKLQASHVAYRRRHRGIWSGYRQKKSV
jgi:hypothetical protein